MSVTNDKVFYSWTIFEADCQLRHDVTYYDIVILKL